MPDVDSKVCTGCKLDLPFGEFHKQSAGKYGLCAKCKACCRKYYESRREVIAARYRARRETDGASMSARQREYYEANRDRIAARQRERYRANLERERARARDWNKANPDKRRDYKHWRRARVRESTVVRFPKERLLERMAYFGNKCYMCGGPFEHIDHVKPLSRGGAHMLSNLRPACGNCNRTKSDKWPLAGLGNA